MEKLFKNRIVLFGSAAMISALTLICIFTPEVLVLKKWADYTVQIMLSFLLLGIFFLAINNRILMYLSFFSCCLLCLFLKSSSYENIRLALDTQQPEISIVHINTSNFKEDFMLSINQLSKKDADIISFQEVNPYWNKILKEQLTKTYPHFIELTRIDPYGMIVFSKHDINRSDTIFHENIPTLHLTIDIQSEELMDLFCIPSIPPVSKNHYEKMKAHLSNTARYITRTYQPTLSFGDLNLVSWSNEIRSFRSQAGLNDSRRSISSISEESNFSFFRVPVDHIFFSDELECTKFVDIFQADETHLGIFGTYQFKNKDKYGQILE